MDNILAIISNLKGVHHACLYHADKEVLSTFPEGRQDIVTLAQMIEQIFSKLQAIDIAHDELYFSVEDKLIAAYLLYDSYIAILLTDKKINFSLVHMGILSASSKIKRHVILHSEKDTHSEEQQSNLTSPVTTELKVIMAQLLIELNHYFGPAAKFVFEEAIIQWETQYVMCRDNIPELGEILLKELGTAKEKSEFSQFVQQILQ